MGVHGDDARGVRTHRTKTGKKKIWRRRLKNCEKILVTLRGIDQVGDVLQLGSSGNKRKGKLSNCLRLAQFLSLYKTISGQQEPSQRSGQGNMDPQHVDSNMFQNLAGQMFEVLNILLTQVAVKHMWFMLLRKSLQLL
ncbi:hypothetical protein Scep_016833 [Stephania cephalantha]|uniref:Uncharacterized protein n=1 Tax=Stephania cephalantha TaxID=152367 RepID=A0AAP0IPC2_9MAGN